MTTLSALVRVREGAHEVLTLWPAGLVVPMSTLLVERALAQAPPPSGVHRVDVRDGATHVTPVGDAGDTVASVRVVREGHAAARVVDVVVSYGDGASRAELDDAVERDIAEAVASIAHEVPEGEERVVDVVIGGAPRADMIGRAR